MLLSDNYRMIDRDGPAFLQQSYKNLDTLIFRDHLGDRIADDTTSEHRPRESQYDGRLIERAPPSMFVARSPIALPAFWSSLRYVWKT